MDVVLYCRSTRSIIGKSMMWDTSNKYYCPKVLLNKVRSPCEQQRLSENGQYQLFAPQEICSNPRRDGCYELRHGYACKFPTILLSVTGHDMSACNTRGAVIILGCLQSKITLLPLLETYLCPYVLLTMLFGRKINEAL